MPSRKEREAEQKKTLANFGDYRRLAANAASVPLVQPPAAGSSYDMFGPRSISLSVPTGFSEKEIEGMMQLTGGKRWKGECEARSSAQYSAEPQGERCRAIGLEAEGRM